MANLTVIIPFLNEGKEVYNTVKNLKDNSNQAFDLFLVNDCSTDGFDYKSVAVEFGGQYIEHSSRIGVAASRDEAIALCRTEFFLLLDAHMRVYQKNWVQLIVEELEKDEKTLLCCTTVSMDEEGNIKPENKDKKGLGAMINFENLSIEWIHSAKAILTEESFPVPCVLGASYACRKKYWKYLKGLEGLLFYGCDEQLISIKVWLEGGICKLLPSVIFGHLFRQKEKIPYKSNMVAYVYNLAFIFELFFKFEDKINFIRSIRKEYSSDYICEAIDMLSQTKQKLMEDKKYFSKIFTRNMDYLVKFNTQIRATQSK